MNFKLVSFLPALSLRFDTEQVQAIKEELLESIGDTEYKTIELDGAPNKSIALVALYFYMKVHAGIKNDAALTISPTQKQEFTDFIMNSIGLCLQTLPWQNQLANGDSTETKLFALASDAQTNKSNILPTVSMIIKSHQELRNQFIDNSRGGILSYLVDQVDLRNPISADNVLNEKSISDQKHQASMELRSLIDPELVPDRRDTWDHPLDSILNEAKNKNKLFFFPTSHGQAPEEERQMVPIDYVVKPSNSVKFQLDLYQRLIKDGFSCIGLDQKAVIPEQVQNELIDAYHGEGRTAQELGSGLKTELNGIFKTLEDFFKDKESSLVTYLKRSGYRFGDQISLDLAKFINFFDSLKMITHNNRVQIDLINEDDRTTKFTQSDSRRIYVFSPLNSSSKILYDDTGGEILSVAQSTYNEYTRSAGSFKSTYLSYMLPNLHHELAQARGWGEYQTVGTHCDKRVKDLMHSDPVYFGKNDVTFDIMPFTLSRSVKFVPDFKLTTVNSDEDQEDLSEMPMVDDHVDSPNESPVLVN